MSKAVLMSINPQWCKLIASGKKTVELRKTKPKMDVPFKVYIYCTQDKRLLHKFNKGERIDDEHFFEEDVFVRQNTWIRGRLNPNGKVIGEFVCDWIRYEAEIADGLVDHVLGVTSCVDCKEIIKYANGNPLYSWHISDLVIYDKPKELSEFYRKCEDYPACDDCEFCSWTIEEGYECVCDYEKPLTRPPQSWMYVEEATP